MSRIDVVRKAMMDALKAGDKPRKEALSLLLSALKAKNIDKRADLTAFLRQCKAMKAALPLSGAVWYEVSGGAVIGHYKSQAGEVTGVFDLSGSRGTAAVPVADGVYEGQLGGRVTVSGGHVSLEGDPFIF